MPRHWPSLSRMGGRHIPHHRKDWRFFFWRWGASIIVSGKLSCFVLYTISGAIEHYSKSPFIGTPRIDYYLMKYMAKEESSQDVQIDFFEALNNESAEVRSV